MERIRKKKKQRKKSLRVEFVFSGFVAPPCFTEKVARRNEVPVFDGLNPMRVFSLCLCACCTHTAVLFLFGCHIFGSTLAHTRRADLGWSFRCDLTKNDTMFSVCLSLPCTPTHMFALFSQQQQLLQRYRQWTTSSNV